MKNNSITKKDSAWAENWLGQVKDGTLTMSQRTVRSIGKNGGMALTRKLAKSKGLHLVQLTDDKGQELVAASTKPFTVIC